MVSSYQRKNSNCKQNNCSYDTRRIPEIFSAPQTQQYKTCQWQQRNPGRKLYLCYFGWVWPGAYGIKYQALPGSWDYVQQESVIPPANERAVWAISATHLQGIYLSRELTQFYQSKLLSKEPLEILGESIYLYEVLPGAP